MYFYPRSPCGERHDWPPVRDVIQWISIHALLAESDFRQNYECFEWIISIHALLAESDQAKAFEVSTLRISIHALLAESDGQ